MISHDDLLRIIDLCRMIEKKGIDPFEVDVEKNLNKLREYLPKWKLLDDLLIDAEALNQLTSIIKLQGDWIRYRSSRMYIDPVIVELKLRMLDAPELSQIFMRSWHPIVSLDQITPSKMRDAMDYWNNLLPISERFGESGVKITEPGYMSRDELVHFIEVDFEKGMDDMWKELKERAAGGRIDYWEFISAETFEETIERSHIVSFLVSNGFAHLDMRPLEEEMFLIPLEEPMPLLQRKVWSVPIPINHDIWMEKHGRKT